MKSELDNSAVPFDGRGLRRVGGDCSRECRIDSVDGALRFGLEVGLEGEY